MKRLFKNDGTLLFGYWIRERWDRVPASYLQWGCENVPNFDLQLERLKQGLDPIPGIQDGTKALPVMKPPVRKSFVSKQVRPMNHTPAAPPPIPSSSACIQMHPIEQAIQEGLSRIQIAERFGISTGTVDKRIKELGLPKPRDGRKDNRVSKEIASMGREVLAAKKKVNEACWQLDVRDGRIRWTAELREQIALWQAQGVSWRTIAKRLGWKGEPLVLRSRFNIHRSTLKKALQEHAASKPAQFVAIHAPKPPKKRNLFQRIWDAILNVTDGPM